MNVVRTHRREGQACAEGRRLEFLNQDCVDVVVEIAAHSFAAVTVLRPVNWAFLSGVGSLVDRSHRASGAPMTTLSYHACVPLASHLESGAAAFKLTAIVRGRSVDTVEGMTETWSSPFRWTPNLRTCMFGYAPDRLLQTALIDVAVRCKKLDTMEFGDVNLALVAPALKFMVCLRRIVLNVNIQRMATHVVPALLVPCGRLLKQVSIRGIYLLNVPWATACPLVEHVELSVANATDFAELQRCPRLQSLTVSGSHPVDAAVELLEPMTMRSPCPTSADGPVSDFAPVSVFLTYTCPASGVDVCPRYKPLVRRLCRWTPGRGTDWPNVTSVSGHAPTVAHLMALLATATRVTAIDISITRHDDCDEAPSICDSVPSTVEALTLSELDPASPTNAYRPILVTNVKSSLRFCVRTLVLQTPVDADCVFAGTWEVLEHADFAVVLPASTACQATHFVGLARRSCGAMQSLVIRGLHDLAWWDDTHLSAATRMSLPCRFRSFLFCGQEVLVLPPCQQ